MEKVVQSKVATESELRAVNECRLFLRAFHLSDIVTADGKALRRDLMHGTPDYSTSLKVHWPLWGKPAATAWTTWRRIMRLVFTNGLDYTLSTPLKDWKHFEHDQWQWFLDRNEETLYKRQGSQWEKHQRIRSRTRATTFKIDRNLIQPPPMESLRPTTVRQFANYIQSEGTANISNPNIVTSNTSMAETLRPTQTKWLFVE